MITDRALKHIALDNRKLKSFRIESELVRKTERRVSYGGCHSLLIHTPTDNRLASDVMLRALSKACRDLQLLYVAGCTRISDHGMKFLGNLKKLKCINIADCHK